MDPVDLDPYLDPDPQHSLPAEVPGFGSLCKDKQHGIDKLTTSIFDTVWDNLPPVPTSVVMSFMAFTLIKVTPTVK